MVQESASWRAASQPSQVLCWKCCISFETISMFISFLFVVKFRILHYHEVHKLQNPTLFTNEEQNGVGGVGLHQIVFITPHSVYIVKN